MALCRLGRRDYVFPRREFCDLPGTDLQFVWENEQCAEFRVDFLGVWVGELGGVGHLATLGGGGFDAVVLGFGVRGIDECGECVGVAYLVCFSG